MKQIIGSAFALIVCFVLSFSLLACSDAPEKMKTEKPKALQPESEAVTKALPIKPMQPTLVTIGTGSMGGVYYPTGKAIAQLVNRKQDISGLTVKVESTGGSVSNINAVLDGNIAFGIAQCDRQFQALNGIAEWVKVGPRTKLRSVFSLYPETVTLVAGADTGINSIRDLKGKKVNIGDCSSGQRQNSIDALRASGLRVDDVVATDFDASKVPVMLQEGNIDAFFYTVGHPSKTIAQACAGTRKVKIIPITDVHSLLAKYPYYVPSLIPMSLYPGAVNSGDEVVSFGVKATLVTSEDVPDAVVYAVTREIFENFDAFKKMHPAFGVLTKQSMLRGLSAPIHPGAMRYYMEVGLK